MSRRITDYARAEIPGSAFGIGGRRQIKLPPAAQGTEVWLWSAWQLTGAALGQGDPKAMSWLLPLSALPTCPTLWPCPASAQGSPPC